jgi:tRNA pseudouridine38/39 synthase
LEAMRRGCELLVGQHDFRNLCKMDVDCVSNFVRVIHSFTLQREDGAAAAAQTPTSSAAALWSLNVRGSAFLWHQVRCMAAVLLLIGKRLEQPSIITQLLDVAAMPGKPAYDMASEQPLLFFDCGHERPGQDALTLPPLPSATPKRTLQLLVAHLTAETRRAAVRAQMFGYALRRAEEVLEQREREDASVEKAGSKYVPLLQRRKEVSYEVQLARRAPGKIKQRPAPSAEDE